MKKWYALTLALLLAFSMAACGCQSSSDMGNDTTLTPTSATKETNTVPSTTDPIVDPTILDPTFETNIPDSTVNDNSTNNMDGTDPTHGTKP